MKPSTESQVTLQAGPEGAFACWSVAGWHVGTSTVTGTSPEELLRHTKSLVAESLKTSGVGEKAVAHATWRLVIAGGFYAMAGRPKGRWTRDLATAAAGDLESVCPVSLDDLHATSIPISEVAAWVCALPKKTVEEWISAASTMGISLDGVWTHAGALVDGLLEQGIPRAESLWWQDGRTRVDIAAAATGNSPSIEMPHPCLCVEGGYGGLFGDSSTRVAE